MYKEAQKRSFCSIFTAFYPHFTLFSTDCSLTVFSTPLLIPFSYKPFLRGIYDCVRKFTV